MINLAAFNKPISKPIFFLVVSLFLLQGCGGQRDEPFNGDSSSSSRGATVKVENLRSDKDPIEGADIVNEEKKIIFILDKPRFLELWRNYTIAVAPDPDMDVGQVVLIDLGKKRICDRKVTLKSVTAFDASVNSAELIIEFEDVDGNSSSTSDSSSSSSASSASCDNETQEQPYYFYYVKTRKELVPEEN